MSDMQSMDRENKKRQLRQNIVQMPDNGSEEPMDGGRLAKYKRKKRIIAAAAVRLAIVLRSGAPVVALVFFAVFRTRILLAARFVFRRTVVAAPVGVIE